MRCTIDQLRRVERDRLPGYVAAVMATATVTERGHLELSDADWQRIRREFALPGNRRPRLRLGDWVAVAARAAGITPARIQRLTRRTCRCAARQHRLNDLSARLERAILRLLDPLGRGR